ncbi:MAG: aminoacyl-tRNA hydrolase [Candidatus Brocadiia bacterium]
MRLIVGIGNPGPQYIGTRHNVGFDVMDTISADRNLSWKSGWSGSFAELAAVEKTILLKPATYVNLSGRSVHEVSAFFKIPTSEILVVVDDYNLPLGKLRLRSTGSDGGHKGLVSIISVLGEDFTRLRVGIGAPTRDPADYVLSRFSPVERETIDLSVRFAADAALAWADGGLDAATKVISGCNAAAEED